MSDILFKLMSAMSVASVPTVGTGTGFTANPETIYGTADYTITTFPSTGAGVNNNTDTIVAVDLTLSATNDGVLFDLGGAGGHGMSAGFENGNLRARAFSASGNDWNTNANAAYVEIDLSNCQYTDVDTTYYFVADFSAGTLEVYAQAGGPTSGNEIFLLGSDTAGASYSSTYGSDGKGYGQVNTAIADLDTNYEVNFNGTIDEIRVWTEDATLDASGFPELSVDTTPDAFTFTDQTNVPVSTTRTSNTITISGMDAGASAAVTVTGGTYSKNSGAYTSTSGTAQNSDTFSVRHTSSSSNSTAVNTTLSVGGISDTFTSTTEASADVTPSNTSWWNNINNPGGTNGITNTVTIAGINTTITLQISFAEDQDGGFCSIVVNSSPVTSASYTDVNSAATTFDVSNGDTVYFSVSTFGGNTSDATATVINTSDGNAVLDTFTILLND